MTLISRQPHGLIHSGGHQELRQKKKLSLPAYAGYLLYL